MSDRFRYEVIVEGNDAEGYSAFLPSLLGCVTAAQTIEEIKTLIVEAVTMHIEGMMEDSLPIPEPLTAQQAEEALGMPVPASVAPGLFVEVSVREALVPTATTFTNPETAYQSRLVSECVVAS